jgi:hypothetical protein
MMLADELSDDSKDSDEEQKQTNQLDFAALGFSPSKKKEVYKMKPDSVKLDCELCRVLYDYNKACEHYNIGSPECHRLDMNQLLKDTENKHDMYQTLFLSLDKLSTYKITALCLTHDQFNNMIMIFVSKQSGTLLQGQLTIDCKTCLRCADLLETKDMSPTAVALRVLCRALAFQIETLMTNDYSIMEKTRQVVYRMDVDPQVPITTMPENLQPSTALISQVLIRLQDELQMAVSEGIKNCELIYLLVRALTNLMLLYKN